MLYHRRMYPARIRSLQLPRFKPSAGVPVLFQKSPTLV